MGIRASEGGDLVWAGRNRVDAADGLSITRLAFRRLARGHDGLTLAVCLAGVVGLVPLVPWTAAFAAGSESASAALLAFQVAEAAVVTFALGLVVMAAVRYAGSQRQELALASMRGWPFGAICRLLLLQYIVIAVLAVPVGLAVAALTLTVTAVALGGTAILAGGPSGPLVARLDAPALALGAVLAGSVVALVASAAVSAGRAQAEAPLAPGRASFWWRRRGLDLLLALVGLVGLLVIGGARMTGAAATVPTTELAALLMGAVVLAAPATLRLQPVTSWLAIHTCRGLPAILVAAELRRHSTQHAGVSLLITLAVLAATCASTAGFTLAGGPLPAAAWTGPEVGLLAAFVASVIGLPACLALHFSEAMGRRQRDYLALSVQGLSASMLNSALAVEQVGVLSGAVIAGTLLGLALGWATLPMIPRSAVVLAVGVMVAVWILTAMAGRLWLRAADRYGLARQLRQPT